jgi:hypothetical protein
MKRPKGAAAAALLAAVAALALATPAPAAEYGLGVAYDNGTTVLLPIRTDSLVIEPEFNFSNQSSSSASRLKNVNVGSGVYVRRNLGPLFESYLGGRLLYSSSQSSSSTSDSKARYYMLAPTAGVQHFLSKQFSLGLDASLEYRHGKQTSTGNPDQNFHSIGTATRILLRAYF